MKRIKSNIGNNQNSTTDDVINIKRTLRYFGIYNGNTEFPYIDSEVENGIRIIQRS